VLGPGVAPALMPLLVAGGFKVSGISIDSNVVTARLCDGDDHCFEARLSNPGTTCIGELVGPWCLSLTGAAPPAAARSALRDILAGQHADEVWSIPRQPEPGAAPPRRWTSTEGTDVPYYLLGLALVLGPLTLGWILGLVFLRLASRKVRPLYFTVAVVAVCGGAVARVEAGELLPISRWDTALFFILVSLGAGIAAYSGTTRAACANVALFITSSVVSLFLVEAATRLFLPTPPGFPPAREAHFRLPDIGGSSVCAMHNCGALEFVYPQRAPEKIEPLVASVVGAPSRVLHVGDSIVFGAGVEREQAFPELLDVLDAPVAHINGSGPGTGPDLYYLVTRALLDRIHPDLVAWYLQASDYNDVDRPYGYCENGPLLEYGSEGPQPRCPEPKWATPDHRERPAPYALRVATGYSFFARHIAARFWRRSTADLTPASQCAHLREILAAARDLLTSRHVAFVVVQDPDWNMLDALLAGGIPGELSCSNESLVKSLGIAFLDGNEVFAKAAAADGGVGPLFAHPLERDCHFSVKGHQIFAAWLKDRLEPAAGITLRRFTPPAHPAPAPDRATDAPAAGSSVAR
jgi:hypothetical protein